MNKKVIENPSPGVLQTTVITLTEKEDREVHKEYIAALRKATEEYKRKERQAVAENRRRRGLPPLIY
ncbi:MAG: hypothetical protein AAB725_00515 [Patescibacteria group bacterium]